MQRKEIKLERKMRKRSDGDIGIRASIILVTWRSGVAIHPKYSLKTGVLNYGHLPLQCARQGCRRGQGGFGGWELGDDRVW